MSIIIGRAINPVVTFFGGTIEHWYKRGVQGRCVLRAGRGGAGAVRRFLVLDGESFTPVAGVSEHYHIHVSYTSTI